jgi:hypothetical protein
MANRRSISGDPLEGTSLAGFANFLGPREDRRSRNVDTAIRDRIATFGLHSKAYIKIASIIDKIELVHIGGLS